MTRGIRIWAIAALLSLLGTPGLSCFMPRQIFRVAETDCCRYMGSNCNSKNMPSQQSCCNAPSQHGQPYLSNGDRSPSFAMVVVFAVVPTGLVPFSRGVTRLRFVDFHSPPLSPPDTNSVLRI